MLGLIILMIIGSAIFVGGCSRHSSGGIDIWDAIESNDKLAIEQFAASGGDVNMRNFSGVTPLWAAFEGRHRASYEALLENGADPNMILSGKRVVTHWAASGCDPWWLRIALEHGADPDLVNVGYGPASEGTPLYFAIGNGEVMETESALENVRLLVEHGADLGKRGRNGCDPLADAGAHNRFRIVLYLLKQDADYEASQCSGMSFLDNVRMKCENRDRWFLRKEDRDALDAVREWLEAKGVEIEGVDNDGE